MYIHVLRCVRPEPKNERDWVASDILRVGKNKNKRQKCTTIIVISAAFRNFAPKKKIGVPYGNLPTEHVGDERFRLREKKKTISFITMTLDLKLFFNNYMKHLTL